MRWFSFIIMLLIGTLLDAGNLLDLIAIGGRDIRPSILITLLVYYAIVCKPQEAISFSFLIGIGADLAAGTMGPHMVCYGLLGTALNSVAQSLTIRQALAHALFVFGAYLISEIIAYWLGLLKTHQPQPEVYSLCFLRGVFSAVVCPLVWSILDIFSGWSGLGKPSTRGYYN